MAPTVSVLVPTYNGVKYLRECMESILAQSFGDFEAIVVDDGSDDGTAELAREYARRDRRVAVSVNDRNLGLVRNWNRALQLARGAWIKFVFQDDSIVSSCLRDLVDIGESTGAALAFGRRDFLFDKTVAGEILQRYRSGAANIERLFPHSGFTGSRNFCRLVLGCSDRNFIGEPVAVLFRREVTQRVGLFNPNLIVFCDMEYWMRVGVNTGVAHLAKNIASFRIHGDSTTAKSLRDRHFRMFALDHLVVSHEFAFHQAFAPLRDAAAACRVDIRKRFEDRLAWTYALAFRTATDAPEIDDSRLRELSEIETAYPRIRRVVSRKRRQRYVQGLFGSARQLISGKWFRQ